MRYGWRGANLGEDGWWGCGWRSDQGPDQAMLLGSRDVGFSLSEVGVVGENLELGRDLIYLEL